ncbi:ring-1,2-phenylacetyl-CoA epoxidase subunit PaaD [Actinopolymorpha cephalotaxi]|uniref:Ring-1,2-phenylacetyl-CoA epoxidase subunit PaaD n=1 Tax=Actinopolymorpha cephalotaxi TaxID=504797 RepID=A0A1I2R8K6_9ACTN|nr:1,2-phenylacetyl-CoA epoxidase subunit PaaD [Actinopolymorpha cephalotaxi]NYH82320.1 ring-1,2-phenylacetyl-CoA epoxidase subunit PaaD [Actinopolymorpha cephalotaxi]SFG36802.1 ring-1,2-phenylacetyl-CoA epoxidase subunit PaaD [Actinopolymorpha cephalotaxi]
MVRPALTPEAARAAAAAVTDPELPVLTIAELGILRAVRVDGVDGVDGVVGVDRVVEVDLTPTYAGCPALEAIESDVKAALHAAGATDVRVRRVLAPAWTTDWITEAGRAKLAAAGIAPPSPTRSGGSTRSGGVAGSAPVDLTLTVRCPRCGSADTRELSRFGPTACTALRTCASCREPFEHVKAL